MSKNPVKILLVLDGWGYREAKEHNAIAMANTPNWDRWWQTYPHTLLEASGFFVGLPERQMGNSEVGHMHIGAGRLIPQDLTRINNSIESQEFFKKEILLDTINYLKANNKNLFIAGLFSQGGVHSHQDHLFAILDLCKKNDFHNVYLHLFLDGRDTPPKSAEQDLLKLQNYLEINDFGQISSISGRFYAMDRDKRYERIQPVYDLITQNKAEYKFNNPIEALNYFYEQNLTDEFIPPTLINSSPEIIKDDAFIFFNYRSDRARELTWALVNPKFKGFKREKFLDLQYFLTMTEYDATLKTKVIFPHQKITNTLGDVIAKNGLKQLRIAETEKYAHVTFFLNGGIEEPFTNEDRILIPSPKVKTYDLKPEMSAIEIADEIVKAVNSQKYDVIIANFANADMVGHTGNINATIQAIETLDTCFGKIETALLNNEGEMLITADHGNAEYMFNKQTTQAHTAHTSEPVPFIYVGKKNYKFTTESGSLQDIAPTFLKLMGLSIPSEMKGKALL